MCCTTEVHGNLKFKVNKKQSDLFKELNTEAVDQWLPNQNRDVSYVSRLQCVQVPIQQQQHNNNNNNNNTIKQQQQQQQ
jgi:hypothetical protein